MLLPHAALAVPIRPVVSACYGAAARYLGLLATTMGRWDEAAGHFEAAVSMNERIAAWPMLAHARRDYAAMLLARGKRGDLIRAHDLLVAAAAAYRGMGMERHAERTRTLFAHPLLADKSAHHVYPDGLTEREVDVLRLLARGRSNRRIAAELVISVRTAENHIASIYSKTGAHGRAAAATYALTHRLIPPD
jgi:DNA-binding NarL/FixJ family response regulator